MTASGKVRFGTSAENCPLELGMRFQIWDQPTLKWVPVEVTEIRSVNRANHWFPMYQTTVYFQEPTPPEPLKPAYTGWTSKPSALDRIAGWFRGG